MVNINTNRITFRFTFFRNRAVTFRQHQCWHQGGERCVSPIVIILSDKIIPWKVFEGKGSQTVSMTLSLDNVHVRIQNLVASIEIFNFKHQRSWLNKPTHNLVMAKWPQRCSPFCTLRSEQNSYYVFLTLQRMTKMVDVNTHRITFRFTFWRIRGVTCRQHQCWVWEGERYVSLIAVIMSGIIISRKVLQRKSSQTWAMKPSLDNVHVKYASWIWNLPHGNVTEPD